MTATQGRRLTFIDALRLFNVSGGENNFLSVSPFNFFSRLLRSAISLSVGAGVPGTASRAITWPGLFVGLDLRLLYLLTIARRTSYGDIRRNYRLWARGLSTRAPALSIGARVLCTLRQAIAGRTTSGHRTGTPQSYLRYVLEPLFLKGSVLRIVISISVENFVDYIGLPYFCLSLKNLKQLAL